MSADFESTQWTLILQCPEGGGVRALDHLCKAYWKPLYAYARGLGCTHQDAEDMIQGFFTHLIESNLHQRADPARGRFRTFMQMTLRNFVSRQHRDATAQKRGGGEARHVGLEDHAQVLDTSTPDALFDKRWALAVLERALQRLEAEQSNKERFAALKPLIIDDERGAALAAEIGKLFGMSEGAVRTTISRLRARYRETIREEVRSLVSDPGDVDSELAHLMHALAG